MGDRGQVYVKGAEVYLYTHWRASELENLVRKALAKKWRWNDDEYLARVIFDTMTKGEHGKETGFGIGSSMHKDVWLVVEVDPATQTVTVLENGKTKNKHSFTEFLTLGEALELEV